MNALRRWRTQEGLTQEQAAKKCGVSQPTLSRAERGDPTVTVTTARTIAAGTKGKVHWSEIFDEAESDDTDPSVTAPPPDMGEE